MRRHERRNPITDRLPLRQAVQGAPSPTPHAPSRWSGSSRSHRQPKQPAGAPWGPHAMLPPGALRLILRSGIHRASTNRAGFAAVVGARASTTGNRSQMQQSLSTHLSISNSSSAEIHQPSAGPIRWQFQTVKTVKERLRSLLHHTERSPIKQYPKGSDTARGFVVG